MYSPGRLFFLDSVYIAFYESWLPVHKAVSILLVLIPRLFLIARSDRRISDQCLSAGMKDLVNFYLLSNT